MIRQAPRLLFRSSIPLRSAPTHRFISTAPPAQKSRSLKNYAARLAIGVGVIYYYNTSQLFAEEPPFSIPPPQSTEESPPQTLESLAIKNRTPPPPTPALATSQPSLKTNSNSTTPVSDVPPTPHSTTTPSPSPNHNFQTSPTSETDSPNSTTPPREDLQSTEEQAGQEGAFNEETGEINWDCPCLGGMAHGPCGEQFREAFSCFIYSKEEPKGMDCIPNFKNMQDCFREHPDIYGAELDDDEAPEDGGEAPAPVSVEGGEVPAAALATAAPSAPSSPEGGEVPAAALSTAATPAPTPTRHSAPSASSSTEAEGIKHGSADEGSVLVPKAAHDATDANIGK